MVEGTLRWFNPETGYGLISPDDGRRTLLVQATDVASASGLEALEKGAKVTYEDDQGGNGVRAKNVSGKRRYSWRDDCRERMEGKEARHEYYAGL